MNKIESYIKNLGKSAIFVGIESIKDVAPNTSSFLTTNQELFKEISQTVTSKKQFYEKTSNFIKKNKVYEAADVYKNSLFEDIRTGKFYNKERIDKMGDRIMGFSLDFDMSMDDLDIEFDTGEEGKSLEALSRDSMSISNTIAQNSAANASMISTTIASSAEYQANVSRQNTSIIYAQNMEGFKNIYSGIGSMNNNLISGNKNVQSILELQAENDRAYYKTTVETLSTLLDIANQSLELQKKQGSSGQNKNRSSSQVGYGDIVGYDGMPDLKNYYKNIKQNIDSNYGYLLGGGFGGSGGNPLLTFATSPLAALPKAVLNKLFMNNIKKSAKSLDESLSGVFASMVTRFNAMSEDYMNGNDFTREMGKILGIDNKSKNKLSNNKYYKDTKPWNGIAEKALVEVIPRLLGKIVENTGGEDMVYDYAKGKFTNAKKIKDDFKDMYATEGKMRNFQQFNTMREYSKGLKFKNGKEQDKFSEDMDEFFTYFMQNGVNLDFNKESYDYTGMNINDKNFKIMKQMFKSMPRALQMQFDKNNMQGASNITRQMKSMEEEGNSVFLNISNDSLVTNKKSLSVAEDSANYLERIYNFMVSQANSQANSGNKKASKKYRDRTKTSKIKSNIPQIKNMLDEKSEFDSFDYDFDESTAAGLTDYIDQVNKKSIDADNPKKETMVDRLLQSKGIGAKFSTFVNDIKNLTEKPAALVSAMIDTTDKRLYEVFYGVEGGRYKGKEVHGLFDVMTIQLQDTFSKVNDWLDEKILNPVKNKFDELGGWKGMYEKGMNFMGVDPYDNPLVNFFKDARDEIKKDFTSIKNEVKDAVSPITDKLGISLNKKFAIDQDGQTAFYKNLGNPILNRSNRVISAVSSRSRDIIDGQQDLFGGEVASTNMKDIINHLKATKRVASSDKKNNKAGSIADMVKEELGDKTSKLKGWLKSEKAKSSATKAKVDLSLFGNGTAEEKAAAADLAKKGKIDPDTASGIVDKLPKYAKGSNFIEKTKVAVVHKGEKIMSRLDALREKRKADKEQRVTDGDQTLTDKIFDKSFVTQMRDEAMAAFTKSKEALFGKDERTSEEKTQDAFNKALNQIGGNLKEYLPTMASGALIGAGVSLFTGMIGGPILGAAVGSAINLTRKSDKVQNLLFGEVDEEGNRQGGLLLNKQVMSVIDKYAPSMKRGGILGALASVVLPGGPITGMMLGAGIGFMHKNEEVQNFLFGEKGLLGEGTDKKVLKALPKMAVGALAGLGLGPFGLVGNMMLGSAVGFATTNSKFQEFLFGKEGEDGEKEGGLFGTIRRTVMKPLKNFMGGVGDTLKNFAEENIAKPFRESIQPIVEEFKFLGKKMFETVGSGINKMFEISVGMPLNNFLEEKIIKPFTSIFSKIFRGISKAAGAVVASPFKLLNATAKHLMVSHMKQGRGDYIEPELQEKLLKENPEKFIFSKYGVQMMANWFGMKKEEDMEELSKGPKTKFSDRIKGMTKSIKETGHKLGTAVDENFAKAGNMVGGAVKGVSDAKSSAVSKMKENIARKLGFLDMIQRPDYSNPLPGELPVNPDRMKVKRGTAVASAVTATQKAQAKVSESKPQDIAQEQVAATLTGNDPMSGDISNKTKKVAKRSGFKDFTTDIKDIRDEVHGQLDGVGYNINTIANVLVEKFGAPANPSKGAKVKRGNKKRRSLMENIFGFLSKPTKWVKEGFRNLMWGKDGKSGILGTPMKFIKAGFEGLKKVGKVITGSIKAVLAIPGQLLGIVKEVGTVFVEGIKMVGPAIGEMFKAGAKLLLAPVDALAATIKGVGEGLGSAIGGLIAGLGHVGGAILETVSYLPQLTVSLVDLGAQFASFTVNLGKGLIKILSSGISGIVGMVSSGFGKLGFNKNGVDVQKVEVVSGTLNTIEKIESVDKVSIVDYIKQVPKQPAPLPTMPTEFGVIRYDEDKAGELRPVQDNIYKLFHKNQEEEEKGPIRAKFSKNLHSKSLLDILKDKTSGITDFLGDLGLGAIFAGLGTILAVTFKDEISKVVNGIIDWLRDLNPFNRDDNDRVTEKGYIENDDFKQGVVEGGAILAGKAINKGFKYSDNIGNVLNKIFKKPGKETVEKVTGEIVESAPKVLDKIIDVDYVDDIAEAGTKVFKNSPKYLDTISSQTGKMTNLIGNGSEKVTGEIVESGIRSLDNIPTNALTVQYVDEVSVATGKVTSLIKEADASGMSKFMKSASGAVDNILAFISAKIPALGKGIDNIAGWLGKLLKKVPGCAKAAGKIGVSALKTVGAILGPLTAAFGFVGGATKGNTANLFHVSVEDVNFKMQTISSCMEGILNLGFAFIIDILNDVSVATMNIDFLHYLAAMIYKALSSKDDADAYDEATDRFKANYEIANQKNIEATGQELSFDAYNDVQNKSLGSKIGDTFTGGMTTDENGNMVYKTGINKNVGNFFGIGVNDPRGISDLNDRLEKKLNSKDIEKIRQNMEERKLNGKLAPAEYDMMEEKIKQYEDEGKVNPTMGEKISKFTSGVKEGASNTWNKTKEGASNIWENTKEFSGKAKDAIIAKIKDMIENNPFTIIGRMSSVWGSDLDAPTKIKRSLSNAIEAFTWGSIKKEDVEQGIDTAIDFGGNLIEKVKPIVTNIFQNNPLTGIPYQICKAIQEIGFSDIGNLLKNVAGGSLQALTFGAVKKEQAISGIEAIPNIASQAFEGAKKIASNIFKNNPLTGIPYQIFSSIKTKGFSDPVALFKDIAGGSLQALTFGAVKKESIVSGIETISDVTSQAFEGAKKIASNIFKNNPLTGIPYQIAMSIKEKGFSDPIALFKDIAGGSLQALTFGAVKKEQAISGIEAIPNIASQAFEGAKKIAMNVFQNNPLTGIPYQITTAIKEKGFSNIPDTFTHILGGTLQALTFGAVKKESVVSAVPKIAETAKNVFNPVVTKIKELAKWNPLRAVGNVAEAFSNSRGDTMDRFFDAVGAGIQSMTFGLIDGGQFASDAKDFTGKLNIKNFVKSLFGFTDEQQEDYRSGRESGRGKTPKWGTDRNTDSKGPENQTVVPHFWQKNPAWKDEAYHTTGDSKRQTIGDSACGPTVASMVAGLNDPDNAYNAPQATTMYAMKNGFKEKDGGTKLGFFNSYFKSKGIASENSTNWGSAALKSSLDKGPIVLMGKSNSASKNTPFGTDHNHYVLATGIQGDKIIVNDPAEQYGGKQFNLNDTISSISNMVKTTVNPKLQSSYKANNTLAVNSNTDFGPATQNKFGIFKEIMGGISTFFNAIMGNGSDSTTSNGDGMPNATSPISYNESEAIKKINAFFAETKCKFNNMGESIVIAAKEFNIDPYLMAAICRMETGGSSRFLDDFNNPAGLMDASTGSSKPHKFATLADGFRSQAKTLHRMIYTENRTTIAKIGESYCPVGAANDPHGTNKYWVSGVTKFYKQLTGNEQFLYGQSLSTVGAGGTTQVRMLEHAKTQVGKDYVYGASDVNSDNPSSFDCSSLVSWASRKAGFTNIGRETTTTFWGDKVNPIDKSQLTPGDLGFRGSPGNMKHIAIYNGNDTWMHTGNNKQKAKVVDGIKGAGLDGKHFGRIKPEFDPFAGQTNTPIIPTVNKPINKLKNNIKPVSTLIQDGPTTEARGRETDADKNTALINKLKEHNIQNPKKKNNYSVPKPAKFGMGKTTGIVENVTNSVKSTNRLTSFGNSILPDVKPVTTVNTPNAPTNNSDKFQACLLEMIKVIVETLATVATNTNALGKIVELLSKETGIDETKIKQAAKSAGANKEKAMRGLQSSMHDPNMSGLMKVIEACNQIAGQ